PPAPATRRASRAGLHGEWTGTLRHFTATSLRRLAHPRQFGIMIDDRLSGDLSAAVPPVPIPNTVVKGRSADDTGGATRRDNRSPPGSFSHRGMEQWQLVGVITRRPLVRIQLPLPRGGDPFRIAVFACAQSWVGCRL